MIYQTLLLQQLVNQGSEPAGTTVAVSGPSSLTGFVRLFQQPNPETAIATLDGETEVTLICKTVRVASGEVWYRLRVTDDPRQRGYMPEDSILNPMKVGPCPNGVSP